MCMCMDTCVCAGGKRRSLEEGERVCAPVGGYTGMHSGRVVKVGQGTVKIKLDDFDSEDVEISCIKPWSKAAVEVCLACFV